MDRNTLEWYDLLARGLMWAGGIVLLLSLIGAVVIAGSDNAVGIAPEAEEQGRGFVALASLGGGIAAAGVLAGLGAILRLQLADRLAKLPAKPGEAQPRAKATEEPKPKPKPKPKAKAKPKAKPKPEPGEPRPSRRRGPAGDEGPKSGE